MIRKIFSAQNFGHFMFVSGLGIALSSIFFMAFVFFSESILGKGVFYFESNRYFAFFELACTAYGSWFVAMLMRDYAISMRKPPIEQDDSDSMPAPRPRETMEMYR